MLEKISWVLGLLTSLLVILVAIDRGLFAIMNFAGWVCREADRDPLFSTKSVCWASGTHVVKGVRYQITLEIQQPWLDSDITPSSINGFGMEKMSWPMYPGLLLRRHLGQPWFKPIARIGAQGRDEYPLDLQPDGEPLSGQFTAEIPAGRSGEVFLFVNDAILPLSKGWQYFYNNNKGKASVSIIPMVPSD